ncbi:hypothetical protein FIBSPDRAFT_54238 [Athelia psychrophila]|uniref:Secreted protein n=1 Tax=Athelia psychrophila TaxID=1759441 RepID=A0A166FDI6_9AGAM|nr:hypothetical protein FIBSPDRAFT_54238 [Fibularhizoctonia sp. CBS 109695]
MSCDCLHHAKFQMQSYGVLVLGITLLSLAESNDLPESIFCLNVVARYRLAVLQHLVPAHGSKCGDMFRVSQVRRNPADSRRNTVQMCSIILFRAHKTLQDSDFCTTASTSRCRVNIWRSAVLHARRPRNQQPISSSPEKVAPTDPVAPIFVDSWPTV